MIRLSIVGVCPRFCTLLALGVLGCNGEVDLGGPSTNGSATSDTVARQVEAAAGTEVVSHFQGIRNFTTIVTDKDYLYFETLDSSTNASIQRCRKSDCSGTLKLLTQPFNYSNVTGLILQGGHLSWLDGKAGLKVCEPPDCANERVVQGYAGDAWTATGPSVMMDESQFYWYLFVDSAIYSCALADCIGGPKLLAPNVQLNSMVVVAGYVYWVDQAPGVMRAAKDGSGTPERLNLDGQGTWGASLLDTSGLKALYGVDNIAVDGPWIYATLYSDASVSTGSSNCTNCVAGKNLIRFRHSEPAPALEWLHLDGTKPQAAGYDGGFDAVFGGELFWVTQEGNLWSCLVDNCSATRRQLGANFYNYSANSGFAVDDTDIYWLSTPYPAGSTHFGQDWNLKRTPRIAQ